ncbi:MAG: DNA mismatch repair protein MutS [Candidatus Babeliaceae bacterium]|nr:DNA mismatch repair protein MutS [Candidatus Babeliaceae bacterium]
MSTTPLLQQYFSIKNEYTGPLLFFQVGDFYELFFEDAERASAFLGIALTKRGTHQGKPVPLCGVPVHSIDHYLIKLVRGGFRVALCNQLEEARPGTVVKRGVTQVLTPGTLTDIKLLTEKTASFCAVAFPSAQQCGLLFMELLTGQLWATLVPCDDAVHYEAELARFMPDEILLPNSKFGGVFENVVRRLGYTTTLAEVAIEDEDFKSWFVRFGSSSASVFIEQSEVLRGALALLFRYLKKNQVQSLDQCTTLWCYSPDDYLMLDARTQRNLELVKRGVDDTETHTLFSLIDRAVTSMGSRMLKKWLLRPLVRRELIELRLHAVTHLVSDLLFREKFRELLQAVGDLERVVGRIVLRRAQFNDYRVLGRALAQIPAIKNLFVSVRHLSLFERLYDGLGEFEQLVSLLERTLNDDPARDWLVKSGCNAELDRLRELMNDVSHAMAAFERKEQERTGIGSLKVTYNKIYGYSLEITKVHRDSVPDNYVRLQTLANRERFTTPALRELEQEIAQAERESVALEQELYRQLCLDVENFGPALKKTAQLLAQADALSGLAQLAYEEGYVCPTFHDGRDIFIRDGRHPVVAKELGNGFISNDTKLSEDERTWIITGPNMGGKSTYLRQVALIVIMAQMGSFVPAGEAILPLCDRIFTRIGAADQLAEGKSTFLVEMEETAVICNRATEKSLVILDEVGRGTSTYDGMAIAQAVLEYLHDKIRARALFATHYHELTILEETHKGVASYHAASMKTVEGIVLLHKILRGKADGSFGIEVAKGACLPPKIIERAQELLGQYHAASLQTRVAVHQNTVLPDF